MKITTLIILVLCLFISNCTFNSNEITNIEPVNELIGEWKLYSAEMTEVKSFFDYLLEEDVIDTVTTKLFTDELNNWTWILNEDSSLISVEERDGDITTNFGEWSLNSEFFISINGKKIFGQNDYYIIDNELILDFKKDIKGINSSCFFI